MKQAHKQNIKQESPSAQIIVKETIVKEPIMSTDKINDKTKDKQQP